MVIFYEHTEWTVCAASASRTTHDATQALLNFSGPKQPIESLYTDNAPELEAAAEALGIANPTSTPCCLRDERKSRTKSETC